ncbi:MAG: hypothetical protein Q9M92_10585 [Enterobacterales bacterium]|nr:hypothetical protein [Enterobacterales bacterium]
MNYYLANSPHQDYIIRQMSCLLQQGKSPEEAIQASLAIVKDSNLTRKALQQYQANHNLSAILQDLGLIQLPQDLLELIAKKESEGNNPSYNAIFQAEQLIQQSLDLFKVRLTTSLSYAVALTFIAVMVSSIIGYKVFPLFDEIFSGFGARLPAITEFLMAWQKTILSPPIIGGLLFLSLLFLYLNVIQFGRKLKFNAFQSRLPFIKGVIEFTQNIRWLSYLKLLSSLGYSIAEISQQLYSPSKSLHKLMPRLDDHLESAEIIGTLDSEIDFQLHQFGQLAEQQVTKAARRLVTFVMGLIVSYIILIIFASYLPIFQLGEAL